MDSHLAGEFAGKPAELYVVRVCHIGETRSEFFGVGADKRVGHHVDLVFDDHQIAHAVAEVKAAGRIRDEQILNTEKLQHPDGEGDLLHRIAFVEVEAALHGYDLLPAEIAYHEAGFVSDGSADGETWDFVVGDYRGILDLISERTESAAEDHSDFRGNSAAFGAYVFNCFEVGCKYLRHSVIVLRLVL